MTRQSKPKSRLFSRRALKATAAEEHRRLLADRADFVAGSIFLFENRDTDGDLLDGIRASMFSETELAGRFARKFNRRLRRLFQDLKADELVTEDELPLFYWPQSSDARMRLGLRLRELARDINHGTTVPAAPRPTFRPAFAQASYPVISASVEPVAVPIVESVTPDHVLIETVTVEPVAVEPVAVEPVAVEPVAVEHVAVEHVAVEPVAAPVVEPVATPIVEPESASTGESEPAPTDLVSFLERMRQSRRLRGLVREDLQASKTRSRSNRHVRRTFSQDLPAVAASTDEPESLLIDQPDEVVTEELSHLEQILSSYG
jgi:hypothetical protein